LGGNAFLLSLCVALFSVGRAISSSVFGWVVARGSRSATTPAAKEEAATRSSRWSLVLSLIVALVGHIMFITADASSMLWLLLISRIATGFGTGVLSVARTIVAVSTTPSQRVRYNAWLGIVAYLGFALTPIIGSVNVTFGSGAATISQYSFGSFLLFICTCLVLLPMIIWMRPNLTKLW
jgi:ceroid-lipofuscinosis MFS transporter 7